MELPSAESGSKELMARPVVASTWTVAMPSFVWAESTKNGNAAAQITSKHFMATIISTRGCCAMRAKRPSISVYFQQNAVAGYLRPNDGTSRG